MKPNRSNQQHQIHLSEQPKSVQKVAISKTLVSQVWLNFNQWYKKLIHALTSKPEPVIREVTTNGATRYCVYDPSTQQKIVFWSQEEVLTWLEERYYRRNTSDWL